ncbi:subclass B1 metallo-beta-lactamase [Solitalea longa]|uniref:beta-lactamase n=1 Tax=Solitalea longa TaxID=2079460 RepID=A0A2S5A9V0_9SPHI|nr:BlaB/IND/MUS family subclass B1 metallo-beta-lactamase [Solitalea longa]POY39371.1 subclass B1 metallo-beta-lactamase [Solitalea longa]
MKTIITLAFTSILLACFNQQKPAEGLKITHLTGDFYVYTTYKNFGGTIIPSNSMYLLTKAGVVMFDTPWDTTQFQPLLDSIEKRHHQKVVLAISTHYHADRTAGLEFLKYRGVKTYTSKQTYDLCKTHNEKQPQYYFINDTTFTVGEHRFTTFYPGAGHTKDNIVIWYPKEKILYGGCFVKSTESPDLGNVADADVKAWPTSVKNVMKKCPAPRFIIPGHFSWENPKSLDYTLQLLKDYKPGDK